MTVEPTVFVGDLHGEDRYLYDVVERYGGKRQLVFLGDYVNRGPNSRQVIQTLVDAKLNWTRSITFLRGNHDQALLDFLHGGEISDFASIGGLATIASYLARGDGIIAQSFREVFPASHLEFLEGLSDYFERDDVFASHCGPNPECFESRAREDVSLGSHSSIFSQADLSRFGKHIVCGHYVQRGGLVYESEWLSVIDTGCGTIPGAPLSVLLWPERRAQQFGGL